jgi:hypothetical protein
MKIVKRVKNKRRARTRATSGATRSGQSERIARSGAGEVAKHPISSLTPHGTMGTRTRTNRVQKTKSTYEIVKQRYPNRTGQTDCKE